MKSNNKNDVLHSLSLLLEKNADEIVSINQIDMNQISDEDISMKDRLKVDLAKVQSMIQSLHEVAAQADPEGKVIYEHTRPDGLRIENKTVPFGTILIIYESRPDVTIEAAATAFKAGNRILLKGGSESLNTNSFLTKLWQEALTANGFDALFVEYLDLSREDTQILIKENERKIDLIIPRGGDALINFVRQNSSAPVIVSGRGNNFIYIDDECDTEMAIDLVLNGKSRLSVCNAIDKVLINRNLNNLNDFVNKLTTQLQQMNINLYGTSESALLNPEIEINDSEDILYEEFLDAKIFFALTDGTENAIDTVNKYSGGHSAVIVTNNEQKAEKYLQEVDGAAVYHNASSRFTDGGQFGVGAEIAISTQKLHFRGPLGAQELVTNKWFVKGTGQIRN